MVCITLTTDFGYRDPYLASVRAALLRHAPEATIVDISHQIGRHDLHEAAWLVNYVWRDFPSGTIHIISVDAGSNDWVCMRIYGHYFLAPDNGILTVVSGSQHDNLITLDIKPQLESLTFPVRDILVPAAAHLLRGGSMDVLGKPRNSLFGASFPQVYTGPDSIEGSVMFLDGYGNAITNITRKDFEQAGRGRAFRLRSRSGHDITELSLHYRDKTEAEMLALFGADGMLEISMNLAHAGNLLGHYVGEKIFIQFY